MWSLISSKMVLLVQSRLDHHVRFDRVELEVVVMHAVTRAGASGRGSRCARRRATSSSPAARRPDPSAAACAARLPATLRVGRNLVDHPVDPRLGRRGIGIVADQHQFLGAFRQPRPSQRRGNVGAFARVLLGDRLSLGKGRTGESGASSSFLLRTGRLPCGRSSYHVIAASSRQVLPTTESARTQGDTPINEMERTPVLYIADRMTMQAHTLGRCEGTSAYGSGIAGRLQFGSSFHHAHRPQPGDLAGQARPGGPRRPPG